MIMRNFNAWLLAAAVCFSTYACTSASLPQPPAIGDEEYGNDNVGNDNNDNNGDNDNDNDNDNGGNDNNNDNDNQTEESMTIDITIGNRLFKADIDSSPTGRAFMERLPLTLDMNELNGNEKYSYGIALPRADRHFDSIAAGELMLYSGNCIVLFYGPAGGYSYTRIGRLQSADGLAAALGSGSVTVTFGAE